MLSRELQVVLVRLRTGHNRLNSHMHGKLKLAASPTCPLWSRRTNHRVRSTKMPPSQSYKRRCVACQHFPYDQTLRLIVGAREDHVIHLPSGLDHVACERQEEEEKGGGVLLSCEVPQERQTMETARSTGTDLGSYAPQGSRKLRK